MRQLIPLPAPPPPTPLLLRLQFQPLNLQLLMSRTPPPPAEGEEALVGGVHPHWRAVAASIGVTPAQRLRLPHELESYLTKQDVEAARCRRAVAQLRLAAAAAEGGSSSASSTTAAPPPAAAPSTGLIVLLGDSLTLMERTGELTVAAEQQFSNLVAFTSVITALTPLQAARVVVRSRPYYPDCVQLVKAVLDAAPAAAEPPSAQPAAVSP